MGLGARERITVNFFGGREPSIYKGCGAWVENIYTFFSFLFGSMKRKPLYLSQQTITTMTFQEFTTQHEEAAFTQAVRLCQQAKARAQKEFPHSIFILTSSDIVFEQQMLLAKWWGERLSE